MNQYRAQFDAKVNFTDSSNLCVEAFRVDLPGPDASDNEVANLLISCLGLQLVDDVNITKLVVRNETHTGTRGGPSDTTLDAGASLVELNHIISSGMTTYPGLPAPQVTPYLTREDSRQLYAPGTEFAIDQVTMVGNTGTYLDSPYHRYLNGDDLAKIELGRLVDLPAIVIQTNKTGARAIHPSAFEGFEVTNKAVLLYTGHASHWGKPSYGLDAPFLTKEAATWLVEQKAVLVGIDSVNIDEVTSKGERPVHTLLLAAGILVVEHLTNLEQLPKTGSYFTAAPPRFSGFGTFPVRAYAKVPAVDTPND